jgi:wyosine [tRNA(Phe)-imidazoG37] synthetase (radical SAM superfamily)
VLLSPREAIVYGPVRSRRLGRSLGINVLPPGRKACTFDCRYCQYGLANVVAALPGGARLPTPAEIAAAVEEALAAAAEPPDWLTFSGHGEPTLHPAFPEIVDRLLELRDRALPRARTAVLSNSSRLHDEEIRRALSRLDARILKLDAGTEATFRRFNQPAGELTLASIVDGLARLGGVTVQSLFAGGPAGNLGASEVDAWLEAIVRIRPLAVQLYSLDRAAPTSGLTRAPRQDLEQLRARLEAGAVPAAVY